LNNALFLALRRMRAPLLVLIATYAIAILGMVLIPGADGQGVPWNVSFFHAFYFITYTATTIGFGEIPYAFTDAQRLWVTFSIYITVIGWFYAIGKIIQLMQDPAFRQVFAFGNFARRVRHLREPFYIVCGYGETGSQLVDALDHRGIRTVVVDLNPERAAEADLANLRAEAPTLAGDIRSPDVLLAAGLRHPQCAAVVVLTSDDLANLSAAISVKLLRPGLKVLSRCESTELAHNMASFGTDHIINPFQLFGTHLGAAVHAPGLLLLREWLTAAPEELLSEPLSPPSGRWVVCGYGRFGREVTRGLEAQGNTVSVVEVDPQAATEADGICGRGTEARTLEQAGIRAAVGLVAGTSDDVNNLAIVMAARALNPALFVVLRRNLMRNALLTDAIGAQFTMQPASVVVHACLALLIEPMLARFLLEAGTRDNAWANELVARIAGVTGEHAPESWSVHVDEGRAPAVHAALSQRVVRLEALMLDPQDRTERMPALALALEHEGVFALLPDESTPVCRGDRILFCGRGRARRKQLFAAANHNVLRYVLTGEDVPGGWLWSALRRRRSAAAPERQTDV
jgi:voltage-gated potassium channel